MELQKRYIQDNFNRASSSYDNVAFVQKECAAKLVNLLKSCFPEFHPQSILDLGTGTGYIPEILFSFFPQSKFTLNDISPSMLAKTKEKLAVYKEVAFILGDMEALDFGFHDLTISNLAVQWVRNLKKMIKESYNNSNVFVFSCLLDGTFNEWSRVFTKSLLPAPTHQYPSKQELESYLLHLKPKKYFFDSQEFTLCFPSASEFIKYLKNLGANLSSQTIPLSDLRKIVKTYTGKINVTYKVFFGVLSRCRSL
ncbi:methyltransferase domain-containing protein [Wolbachia endosymbiont of Cimex lectularius]|uniref:Malonyl-CoA methyltransferase n=4 Tax=unclassified Wolbachia TaxID=2640676 RepID=A0A060Q087_9RICK|nr:methyltransferase domain-containing protein [Wolbachia endosymbiont of Cimex lectularius]AWV91756.1 BioC [Wolbachia endosymbiont of Cimex cf. emarginatus]BAP01347.1 malonyl-CoA methyltransferase [Wolbachia sp. SYDL]BAP01355.1 malonyl-CoA methyltransferase [Wolbachia sp. TUA]BAP01363.1 malonyl-CoA methyltransferase [Wolbachia sp. TIH]BAP00145.1 malonyl-CoA O-methyltransferase [Wolbachia endosymbiont of Cimex lectularius]